MNELWLVWVIKIQKLPARIVTICAIRNLIALSMELISKRDRLINEITRVHSSLLPNTQCLQQAFSF